MALVPVFTWLLVFRDPPAPLMAAAVFAAAAATDGLDGWVARRLHLVSGFGQFLDPLADKLLIGVALVALALDRRIPWWAVVVILGRDVIVQLVLRVRLARAGRALPASALGKLKTFTQIAAVVLLTALPRGNPWGLGLLYLAVVLTVLSGILYVWAAKRGRAGVEWR